MPLSVTSRDLAPARAVHTTLYIKPWLVFDNLQLSNFQKNSFFFFVFLSTVLVSIPQDIIRRRRKYREQNPRSQGQNTNTGGWNTGHKIQGIGPLDRCAQLWPVPSRVRSRTMALGDRRRWGNTIAVIVILSSIVILIVILLVLVILSAILILSTY